MEKKQEIFDGSYVCENKGLYKSIYSEGSYVHSEGTGKEGCIYIGDGGVLQPAEGQGIVVRFVRFKEALSITIGNNGENSSKFTQYGMEMRMGLYSIVGHDNQYIYSNGYGMIGCILIDLASGYIGRAKYKTDEQTYKLCPNTIELSFSND